MTYDVQFYEDRLQNSKNDPQRAVWKATKSQYAAVKKESTEICAKYISPSTRILDAGCAIGELTECLPEKFGGYLGIDFCNGYIEVAKERYPKFDFLVCNLLHLTPFRKNQFDLAICRTIQGIITEQSVWRNIVNGLLRIATQVLVFRATLVRGDTLKSVEVIKKPI